MQQQQLQPVILPLLTKSLVNLQLSNAATTSNANVGSYSISNLSGITISDEAGANASSGALAANYTLTGGTHTFAINRKSVNIAGTRQYDGTTNIAAADISTITDTVNSEVLSMSGGLGTTSSANVAAYNLVNTSQGTLTLANGPSGANQGLASNYTLNWRNTRLYNNTTSTELIRIEDV